MWNFDEVFLSKNNVKKNYLWNYTPFTGLNNMYDQAQFKAIKVGSSHLQGELYLPCVFNFFFLLSIFIFLVFFFG